MTRMLSIRVLLLLLGAQIGLFAGGRNGQEEAVGSDEQTMKSGEQRITVRLITDGSGIDDRSFNAAAWRGLTSFYGDSVANPALRGRFYDTLISSADRYDPTLRTLSDDGYDLIIATGFTFAQALSKVAADYPEQHYLLIDTVAESPHNNITSALFAENQGTFLVGLAAALKAKEEGKSAPKFGFIGGIPGAVITRFQVGYIQGIRTIFPQAEVLDYYANEWTRPDLAKAKAEQWYNSGVDTIFSAAGYTGTGVIQAAKEMRQKGKSVWAIGVDSDQFEDGIYNSQGESAILTSAVKKVETPTITILKAIEEKKTLPVSIVFDLKNNGMGLPPQNPNLSAEILATIDDYRQQVIDGKIVVDATVADLMQPGHSGAGLVINAVDD